MEDIFNKTGDVIESDGIDGTDGTDDTDDIFDIDDTNQEAAETGEAAAMMPDTAETDKTKQKSERFADRIKKRKQKKPADTKTSRYEMREKRSSVLKRVLIGLVLAVAAIFCVALIYRMNSGESIELLPEINKMETESVTVGLFEVPVPVLFGKQLSNSTFDNIKYQPETDGTFCFLTLQDYKTDLSDPVSDDAYRKAIYEITAAFTDPVVVASQSKIIAGKEGRVITYTGTLEGYSLEGTSAFILTGGRCLVLSYYQTADVHRKYKDAFYEMLKLVEFK